MNIDEQNVGSHRAVLLAACVRTQGPIIEVGAGTWSTPLLVDISRIHLRPLVTVEHNADWRPKPSHELHQVTDSLREAIDSFPHFGVALIDGPAEERAPAIVLLLPKTDIVVVHDTDSVADYPGLREILERARYRHDFPVPTTTVISDLVPWP